MNFTNYVYQMRHLEEVITDSIANKLDSLWDYKVYVNTPDMEMIQTFSSDLMSEFSSYTNEFIGDHSMEIVIKEFNRVVQAELISKLDQLIVALDRAQTTIIPTSPASGCVVGQVEVG